MGSPWYRPTRVNHLVAGADFGWRGVTGNWPPYFPDHPDNARPNLDIGKGSPTAVQFGYGSKFPARVSSCSVHSGLGLRKNPGSTHDAARRKLFLSCETIRAWPPVERGRFWHSDPDGAMYFVTGGRETQSGLYRVRFVGRPTDRRNSHTAASSTYPTRSTIAWLASQAGVTAPERGRCGRGADLASPESTRIPGSVTPRAASWNTNPPKPGRNSC